MSAKALRRQRPNYQRSWPLIPDIEIDSWCIARDPVLFEQGIYALDRSNRLHVQSPLLRISPGKSLTLPADMASGRSREMSCKVKCSPVGNSVKYLAPRA